MIGFLTFVGVVVLLVIQVPEEWVATAKGWFIKEKTDA
jgi:hypothetical protein